MKQSSMVAVMVPIWTCVCPFEARWDATSSFAAPAVTVT